MSRGSDIVINNFNQQKGKSIMPTININSIQDNAQVYITGVVDYSHISRPIDGEELEADNARKVARGMRIIDKPHTRLAIAHASVNYANPAAPTLAEQYIAEKLYVSTAHPEKGDCFTAMNKSKNLPEVYCRTDASSLSLEGVAIEGEIAVGTNVTLILRFFATKQNKGVSLDAVIVNTKPVKWVNGGGGYSVAETLAERGFQITSAPVNVADVRTQLDANVAPAPVAQSAPAAAPYMQAQPAPVTPIPAPVAAAPVQAATAPAPVPAAPQNAAPSLPIPPKGYTYDGDGRIVPIAQTSGIRL